MIVNLYQYRVYTIVYYNYNRLQIVKKNMNENVKYFTAPQKSNMYIIIIIL